jgi:tricorn protease-like protein
MHRFYRNDKWENVEPENVQWIAYFHDGNILKQFDDSGIFHQICEIDLSILDKFEVVSNTGYRFIIPFKPGMKIEYFYRNVMINSVTKARFYCFGYSKNTQKHLVVIAPDRAFITDDVDMLHLV